MIFVRYRDYIKELKELGEKLCKGTGFVYKQFDSLSKEYGRADTFPNAKSPALSVNTIRLKMPFISRKELDYSFISALIATFHEKKHIDQFLTIENGTAKEEIAVDMLARLHNQDLYDDNYAHMPYEIEAEMHGVIDAYSYLLEKHKEIDALQAIKDYAASQSQKGDIRYQNVRLENCNSIKDIYNSFIDYYNQSLKQLYRFNEIYLHYNENVQNLDFKGKCEDNLIYQCFAKSGTDTDSQRPNAQMILDLMPTRVEQSRFIGAYTLKVHPEYKNTFKQLDGLNFTSYLMAYVEAKYNADFYERNSNEKYRLFQNALAKTRNIAFKYPLKSDIEQKSENLMQSEKRKNFQQTER